jgi:hypothetical protein
MESVRSETYSGISSTKSDAQKWESYIKRVPVGSAVKTSWETYGATLTGNASYENFRLWLNGLLARANLTEITAPRIISYMAALADAKTLDDKLLKLPAEKRPGESLTLKIYRAIKEKNLDEVKRISSLIKQYNQDSEHTDPKQFDRKDTTPST